MLIFVNIFIRKKMNFDEEDDEDVLGKVFKFEEMLVRKQNYFFDVDDYVNIIDFYLETEEFSKIESALKYAMRQHPTSIELKTKKVHLLIHQKRLKEASKLVQEIERYDKENYEILILKGSILNLEGNFEKAEEEFKRALDFVSKDEVDMVYYNIALAFEHSFESYKCNSDNKTILFDIAYCYEKTGELDLSIKYYSEFIDFEPFSANAWYNLGTVYSIQNKFEKAIDAYEYAVAINIEYSSAYFNMGNAYASLENFKDAIESYQEYLKINPSDSLAMYYMGEAYEYLDDFESALKHYKNVIEIDEVFADAYIGIGEILFKDGEVEEAVKYVKLAIDNDVENSEYWFLLAQMLAKLENQSDVISAYEKSLELDQKDEIVWMHYAEYLFDINQVNKAISVLKRASDNISDSVEISYSLASYLAETKSVKTALKFLEKAMQMDATKYEKYAEYFEILKDNPEFIQILKKYNI